MSKFLTVPNGNYTLTVQTGGSIRLDTGPGSGEVRITGDLIVEGETTTIESTITTIADPVIILNNNESGNGVSLREAGLQIDRGNVVDQLLVFDEDVSWLDPTTATSKDGLWHFKDALGDVTGIRTNSINTAGGDLYLINSGNGVISVTGTNNYETNILNYTAPNTIDVADPFDGGNFDDDTLPNTRALIDYVSSFFGGVFQSRIDEGTVTPTYVEAHDFEVTGLPSYIDFGIDNTPVAQFFSDRVELNDIRISGTLIETTSSDSDLVLSAIGSGAVRINDQLQINYTPGIDDAAADPIQPTDGVKIYAKLEDTGNTGLYFVNSSSTRDELISNNRSLVYSMLF
jgi:hypothetical protein